MEPRMKVPGITGVSTTSQRTVLATARGAMLLPESVIADGAQIRDIRSTSNTAVVQAGMPLGFVTATGKLGASVIGALGEAVDGAETAITVTAAVGRELLRRFGATGSFKIVGPASEAGTVQVLTVTLTSIAADFLTINIGAIGVNEVQTLNIGGTISGGTFKLGFTLADGSQVWTDTIAHNATFETVISAANTALDNLLGASCVVASGTAWTAIVLTFSGTGYAATPQAKVDVDVSSLTGASTATVARTTAGVSGEFVTGSLAIPADGSENMVFVLGDGDGTGTKVIDRDAADIGSIALQDLLVGGVLKTADLAQYPSDASIKAWYKAQLRARGQSFLFDDDFNA